MSVFTIKLESVSKLTYVIKAEDAKGAIDKALSEAKSSFSEAKYDVVECKREGAFYPYPSNSESKSECKSESESAERDETRVKEYDSYKEALKHNGWWDEAPKGSLTREDAIFKGYDPVKYVYRNYTKVKKYVLVHTNTRISNNGRCYYSIWGK